MAAVLGLSSGVAFCGALLTYFAVDGALGTSRRVSDAEYSMPFVEMSANSLLSATNRPPEHLFDSEGDSGGASAAPGSARRVAPAEFNADNPFAQVERALQRL